MAEEDMRTVVAVAEEDTKEAEVDMAVTVVAEEDTEVEAKAVDTKIVVVAAEEDTKEVEEEDTVVGTAMMEVSLSR